jgi:hypothetical protein
VASGLGPDRPEAALVGRQHCFELCAPADIGIGRCHGLVGSQPGVSILLPAMTMAFTSAVTFNYPSARIFSLTLQGAGPDSTILNWPSTNGLVLNMTQDNHSFHIRDMTLTVAARMRLLV